MGADVQGAHAHLATVDAGPQTSSPLERILDALLLGSGAQRGIAIEPQRRTRPVARGIEAGGEAVEALVAGLTSRAREISPSPELLRPLFFGYDGEVSDPRPIPLTVGDELLALVVLQAPPEDPVGFASVTAHAASLLARARMVEKVRESDFELKYRVWELESLYDVGLSIARTLDLDSLADEILLKSVSLLNARNGTLVVRLDKDRDELLVKSFGQPLVDPGAMLDLSGDVVVINRPEEKIGPFAGALAEKLLAVPIAVQSKPLGVLVVADKENRAGGVDDFGPADARILSLFANQAAIALENARLHREEVEKEKMEREIELAAFIQRAILPEALPEVPGLELAGGNRPTRQVGGDFYDACPLPDGTVALCVADVSGKGVPAALLVSTVHACLHLLLEEWPLDLAAMMERINRHLTRFSSTRKFVTFFLALFDPGTGKLRYVNAGHNPGILVSSIGVTLLPSCGLPIGMFPAVSYQEQEVLLGAGDILALYSDGITEAANALDEEFGMDRLVALVSEGGATPLRQLTERIFQDVDEFTRGVPQYDDQTLLMARPRLPAERGQG